jgi:hypothetical protein
VIKFMDHASVGTLTMIHDFSLAFECFLIQIRNLEMEWQNFLLHNVSRDRVQRNSIIIS